MDSYGKLKKYRELVKIWSNPTVNKTVFKYSERNGIYDSFSEPHLAGYTLILLQEMNLDMISKTHWNTSCLCVNSGDINDDVSTGTDYASLAKAIGSMEKGFVVKPCINNSDLGFKPDMENKKALFGLSAINGISGILARRIIDLRPFNSFEDFIERCVDTKLVSPSKVYNLIKSGAFDCFDEDRVRCMAKFVTHMVPAKEKLTLANIPKLYSFGALPQEYMENYRLLLMRKELLAKQNCRETISSTIGLYACEKIFFKYHIDPYDFMDCIEYDQQGVMCVNNKEFNKIYKSKQAKLEEWIKSKQALSLFNYCSRNEVWNKYCQGTVAKWEMDSISFYTGIHEIEEIGADRFYKTKDFFKLPKQPITALVTTKMGRQYKRFDVDCICGVVVGKNKPKSIVSISTVTGVVDVKMNKDTFTTYDRGTENEKSWFERGTKLLIVGYRRGEMFIPKFYNDLIYRNMIMKIDGPRLITHKDGSEEFYY